MFYTIGQRKKWQRILYVVLPILSIALVILAYALVQMRLSLLLPDAGALWARRWQKAGQFRRQDLGWALTLGGGLMMLPVCLSGVLDRLVPEGEGPSGAPWSGGLLLIVLALGLLLALLPARERRANL